MVWVVLAMSKSNEPWTKLVEKSTAEKRCSSKDSISCLFSNNDWLWQTKWFIECELRLESRTCLSKPWELVKPQLHVAKMPTPPDTSLGRATRDEDEHNEAFALSEITWRNSCGVVESQLSDAWVVYQMLVAYGFSWTGFSFWWSLLSDFREDLPAPVRHEPLHHQRILRYVCTMLLLRVIGSPREGQPRFFGPKLMQPWEKEIDMESIQDSKKSKGSLMYPPHVSSSWNRQDSCISFREDLRSQWVVGWREDVISIERKDRKDPKFPTDLIWKLWEPWFMCYELIDNMTGKKTWILRAPYKMLKKCHFNLQKAQNFHLGRTWIRGAHQPRWLPFMFHATGQLAQAKIETDLTGRKFCGRGQVP